MKKTMISLIILLALTSWNKNILPAGEIKSNEDSQWSRLELDSAFRSEGVAATDVNHDGKMDVIAGDVWYEAPDWKVPESFQETLLFR